MNGRNLLRIGGPAAMFGAVLVFLGTFLHPSGADPNDASAAFREYAADRLWIASHLTQFFGIAFITVGLLALYRSLSATGAAAIARVAVVGAVASLASRRRTPARPGPAESVQSRPAGRRSAARA